MIEEMIGQDTSLSTKAELIRSRIELLKEQWARVQLVESLLSEGDSLKKLGAKNLAGAFDRYLTAGTFDLKRDRVLAGLDAVEAQFQLDRRVAIRLPKKDYLDLLIRTTKAFEFTGNQIAYNQRIKTIGRLHYVDFSQIQDEQIRSLTLKYQRSFSRRVSFFAGMRYRFGQQSGKPILKATLGSRLPAYGSNSMLVKVDKPQADLEPNIDVAVNVRLSDKISIGAGVNRRQYLSRNYYTIDFIELSNQQVNDGASTIYYTDWPNDHLLTSNYSNDSEAKTNFYLNVYLDVLRYFRRRGPLGIQLITGLEYNSNKDIIGNIAFNNFQTPQNTRNLSFETTFAAPYELYVDSYLENNNSISGMDLRLSGYYYADYRIRELELSLGLRFTFEPFRTFRNIGLFSEISYRQSLPGLFKPRMHFNLADVAIEGFPYSRYGSVPQEEINQFLEQLKDFYDVDISIDSHRRQLLYAWNLNTGIYYRF